MLPPWRSARVAAVAERATAALVPLAAAIRAFGLQPA
jgi:hypothetical protein